MNITVAGAGAWGTALGMVLAANKHQVTLWGRNRARLAQIAEQRENELYLPGVRLPEEFRYESDMDTAVAGADMVILAAPSKAFAETAARLANFDKPIVSVTKGIDFESGDTLGTLLKRLAPKAQIAALSGPTLAPEVARNIPSAIVAAAENAEIAQLVQTCFHRPAFRVYTSLDLPGVELGGALKNVIAIAAGVGDGLGFGDNTKAALITRAIAEIRRLGVACGAQPETFSGLSGLGDLTLTCFAKASRNRTFGERIGKGETPESILSNLNTVAEGYPTARAAHKLAHRMNVSIPIIDEVYQMLFEGKDVRRAVHDLMTRESKAED